MVVQKYVASVKAPLLFNSCEFDEMIGPSKQPKVDEIIDRICAIEMTSAPRNQAIATIDDIRRAARTSTHM